MPNKDDNLVIEKTRKVNKVPLKKEKYMKILGQEITKVFATFCRKPTCLLIHEKLQPIKEEFVETVKSV